MEQTNVKTEAQEQQTAAELRPWVTPVFERVALEAAMSGLLSYFDGTGFSS